MGENSAIPWCHHTFNPWWGCTKISPGCVNCYAEGVARRFGETEWGPQGKRRVFGDKHWNEPLKWNRKAAQFPTTRGGRVRVFCGSMCDVFEDHPLAAELRPRLFDLIERTPSLTWLLLTKRPDRMLTDVPTAWFKEWPDHVWALTTIENQDVAELRASYLVQVPASIRGVSAEPLLGPLSLAPWLNPIQRRGNSIDWVIAGAESGQRGRPMNERWVRVLRDQCLARGTPFFYKQRIEGRRKIELPELDGQQWSEFPVI